MKEKLGICCDHAGYEMKLKIKPFLEALGFDIVDFGTDSPESCDYADFAHPMAEAIDSGELNRGISICGSGNGINMTTNKHPLVRAALCWQPEISRLARAHNNANVCSLPGRFIDFETAKEIITLFLDTEFEGGRHQRRIDKILPAKTNS